MTKAEKYEEILTALTYMVEEEDDPIAVMATVVCELHNAFSHFDWTGFYRTKKDHPLLIVGPYQGTHGCLRIAFTDGVCGTAAATKETQLVDDVTKFEGHIACSSTTKSEIVVPILNEKGEVLAVFDVDSNAPAAFDAIDEKYLTQMARWISAWDLRTA